MTADRVAFPSAALLLRGREAACRYVVGPRCGGCNFFCLAEAKRGHDGSIKLYHGASDRCQGVVDTSVNELLESTLHR